MDAERLHSNIWTQLREDTISAEHLNNQSDTKWTLDPNSLLCHLRCIYFPNSRNLRLHVLQYSHNHPLAGHFGQMKTIIKSICNAIGLDFQSMSRTTANCTLLVPMLNLCTTNPMDFSSNF